MDWPIVTAAATNQGRPVTQLLHEFAKKYSKEIWMTA